jgi:hypothetical protein
MRKMTDGKGVEVAIEIVRGDDAYATMIEGTPYLARKFRLHQCRQSMKHIGNYVDGVEELERELAAMSPREEVWAPNERWYAKLITATDWETSADREASGETRRLGHRHVLTVHWYQQGGDPMARLANLVGGLDVMQYSQAEVVEFDD